MDDSTPTRPERKRPLLARLDAAAQDLNAMLLVLAIGLAVLDFTCFFALEGQERHPAAHSGRSDRRNPGHRGDTAGPGDGALNISRGQALPLDGGEFGWG